MGQNDLVSIVMPAYNCGKFIDQSIKSVLEQSYTNWELLIVNDCSTDDTVQIIETFKKKNKRIKLFHNAKNSGGAISRNHALLEAHGKWIAFLDADDLWAPTKLEKQINFMEENNYAFSYTNYQLIDENGNPLNKEVSGPQMITKRMMFNSCYVGCLTVMYNRNVIGDIQIRDIKKRNDYAIWLKAIKKSDCYLLNQSLAYYRKGNNSISSGSKFKLVKYHYELFRRNEELNPLMTLWYTSMNLIYGLVRKIKYTKRIKK